MAPGAGLEPPSDDEEENADKIKNDKDKDAKKFNLDKENPSDKNILENLDTNAEQFIAKHRKGAILREFPGEYLDKPLREILKQARTGDKIAKTARKLLIDSRFSK